MNTVLNKEITIPAQLKAEFQTLLGKTFAAEPDWLRQKRTKAFEQFCETGIPGRKNEEYKYSELKKIFSGNFSAVHNEVHKPALDLDAVAVEKDSIRLVFINGWLYRESSLNTALPAGAAIGSMSADALFLHPAILEKYWGAGQAGSKDALLLLNNAFWFDGAFIYLPARTVPDKTIEIIHLSTGEEELLVNPRHLIIAEAGAQLRVIEHSISSNFVNRVIVNSCAEIFLGENAQVKYYKVQDNNPAAIQLHTTLATQQQNSVFDTCTFTRTCGWVRNNLAIALNGQNCIAHLNGLFLTNGSEHVDNHTQVYHNEPHCESNQLYKGILDGKSTGIFNGKIYVKRDAQKTNAYQSSKNILLSDDATINTKPQLEIYADDVKCSHGSSTGRLDEDALFYLRARGLGEDSARRLLLHAFASDVLNTVQVDALRERLEERVHESLEK